VEVKPPDHPDEAELMRLILDNYGRLPYEIWGELGHGRRFPRGNYVLEKWASKDWWEHGVSLRGGWLTEAGTLAFEKALTPEDS
jgi:hypothetical protein